MSLENMTQEQSQLRTAIQSIRQQATQHNQREVIVLSGDSGWCNESAGHIVDSDIDCKVEWIGKDQDLQQTQQQHFQAKLGREVDVLIFPLTPDFDANRLTALSGMIRGGGLLVLLLTKDLWNSASHFDQRFIHALHHAGIHWLQQGKAIKYVNGTPEQKVNSLSNEHGNQELFLKEQAELVDRLFDLSRAQQKMAIVIQSDRGRGKSAALGLVAAQWLAAGESAYLTGPSLKSVEQVFLHAQQALPEAESSRGCLTYHGQQLKFLPPDAVHTEFQHIKRLLVDEAAAIPIPKLTDWLEQIPQIIFSTTIHGYEGTGKGFLLKFCKVLDLQRPDWQKLQLQHPIRWESDDFLEQWLNQLFLLDVDIVSFDENMLAILKDDTVTEAAVDKTLAAELIDSGYDRDSTIISAMVRGVSIERYSSYDLANDEHLLKQIYGLLINAHYRTTPKDLRYLLDTDAASVYALRYDQTLLAAAWVMYEGEFDQDLSDQVYLGVRRPAGHLLAQSLTYHCAIQEAATYRYARIVRIAVHPQCQRQGLGSRLLKHILQTEAEVDVIGTSFSATPEGLDFWQQNGFTPVRIGMSRHQSSGEHSVMLLSPVSEAGQWLTDTARSRMLDALPFQLQEPLADLDEQLVQRLTDTDATGTDQLSEADWQELVLFAYAHRTYAEALAPLMKLMAVVEKAGGQDSQLSLQQAKVLREKVSQHHCWEDVVSNSGLEGQKQAILIMREAVQNLLHQLGPVALSESIDWVQRQWVTSSRS